MGELVTFNRDAGKIQEYLKTNLIPVKAVTVGGGDVKVELEDKATATDKANLKAIMEKMGWL